MAEQAELCGLPNGESDCALNAGLERLVGLREREVRLNSDAQVHLSPRRQIVGQRLARSASLQSLVSRQKRFGTAPRGAARDTKIHECARSVRIGDYTGPLHGAAKKKPRLRRGYFVVAMPGLEPGT